MRMLLYSLEYEWNKNSERQPKCQDVKYRWTKTKCDLSVAVSRELPVETETIQTQLHQRTNEEHYTYTNVPWRLYLRKEVCTCTKNNTDPLSEGLCFILLFYWVFFLSFTGFLSQRQLQQSSGAGSHLQTGNGWKQTRSCLSPSGIKKDFKKHDCEKRSRSVFMACFQ